MKKTSLCISENFLLFPSIFQKQRKFLCCPVLSHLLCVYMLVICLQRNLRKPSAWTWLGWHTILFFHLKDLFFLFLFYAQYIKAILKMYEALGFSGDLFKALIFTRIFSSALLKGQITRRFPTFLMPPAIL